jgi:hypothetical protein
MKGWVYILSNESLEGLVKIGFSTKDPEGRARELSSDTGVPTPFTVEYEMLVENPHKCEQRIHELLDHKRVNQKREFFKCSVEDSIKSAKQSAESGIIFEKFKNDSEGKIAISPEISEPLLGLIKYIVGDGEITNHEVYHLCSWMNDHPEECNLWPGTILVEPLNEAYADGVLTNEELQHIAMILMTIVHKHEDNQELFNEPNTEDNPALPPVIKDNGPSAPKRKFAEEREGIFGGILQWREQKNLDKIWKEELGQFQDEKKRKDRTKFIENFIMELKNGSTPPNPPNVFLRNNERALWSEQAQLLEEIVVDRRYESGSSGVNFKIAKGVSWKVGATRGRMISEKGIVPVDHGAFIMTDKRLIFDGALKSFDVNLTKIISINFQLNGVVFTQSNRSKQRKLQFNGENGDIMCAIINYLGNQPD